MVEEQLEKLQNDFDSLTDNDFFFSCIQIATVNAMRAYQEEKRQLFANTIFNAVHLDLDADKKMLFLSLLDRYTLAGIRLLQYYSKNHYQEDDFVHHGGMSTAHKFGGTEYPLTFVLKSNPERPQQARRKRTTHIGDEFLAFIAAE